MRFMKKTHPFLEYWAFIYIICIYIYIIYMYIAVNSSLYFFGWWPAVYSTQVYCVFIVWSRCEQLQVPSRRLNRARASCHFCDLVPDFFWKPWLLMVSGNSWGAETGGNIDFHRCPSQWNSHHCWGRSPSVHADFGPVRAFDDFPICRCIFFW